MTLVFQKETVRLEERVAPTVSIVVPCRNEKDHIETCPRSILAQELPPDVFELTVADGLSTNGTCDILKQLVEEDRRLRIVDIPGCISRLASTQPLARREAESLPAWMDTPNTPQITSASVWQCSK